MFWVNNTTSLMLSFQRNNRIFKWQFTDCKIIMDCSFSSSSNYYEKFIMGDPKILVKQISRNFRTRKKFHNKGLFISWLKLKFIASTTHVHPNISFSSKTYCIQANLVPKNTFWYFRNIPLFFAESEYRIYTRLQPLLQIFYEFFIIFCRIGIFRNEIFLYLVKLMNFQIGRIIFW